MKDFSSQVEYSRVSEEALQLFLIKNADYGDSYKKYGLPGILIRLRDKIDRAITVSDNHIHVKNESLRDTMMDMANYSFLAVALLDNADDAPEYEDDGF